MNDNAYKAPESNITLTPNQEEQSTYQWWNIHSRLNRTQYFARCYGFSGAVLVLLFCLTWILSVVEDYVNFPKMAVWIVILLFVAWGIFAVIFGVITTLQRINDFKANQALVLLLFIPLVNLYFIFHPSSNTNQTCAQLDTHFYKVFSIIGTVLYFPLMAGYTALWMLLFEKTV